jgi:predicted nuclease of predicted toxin-antitoxin system
MRILLDQNTPFGVRRMLAGHDVRTAYQMGWPTLSNSDLLDAAEQAGFEALVTTDHNMVFQQNLTGRNIAVVVLTTNYWPTIRAQPQTVRRAVANATPGNFTIAQFGRRRRAPRPPDLKC